MLAQYTEEELCDHLQFWMYNTGRKSPDLSTLCQLIFDEFIDLELQVARLNLGVFVMHPELAGVAYQITPNDRYPTPVTISLASLDSDVYRLSPINKVVKERVVHRWRLDSEKEPPFPFLIELREQGFTDYIALPLLGTHDRVHVLSLGTKRAGGFYDDLFYAMSHFAHPFAMLVDSLTTQRLSEVLLQLYVGRKTGSKVLNGEVRLGEGQTIRAALLYSDMRGFSDLCSKVGALKTIGILNQYLSIVSTVIQDQGGEILKFMGDAILAIFPVDSSSETSVAYQTLLDTSAADACLRSARFALKEIGRWNAKNSDTPIKAGFGLTLGEVFYGNIGAPGRLDFTVIGEAVNLAARLEGMCKVHQSDVLVGPDFQKVCHAPLRKIGATRIKGFPDPLDIFSLSS